ncbi:MAG: L-rhamnose/proton symporter RhaT [Verrucomicrobiota bacterium]
MDSLLLPLFILIIASVFQGTFGLGMKYVKPLAWEAWWLVHATIAMVIFPLIWALIVVPDLFGVLSQAPQNEVFIGALLGFLWGIGGIMFGVSVGYIGMSLTYGIVMGSCAISAALISMARNFTDLSGTVIGITCVGLALFAVAVYIITVGGLKRDKMLAEAGKEIQGIAKGAEFKKGLIIAVVCGLLSAMLAIGFENTVQIGEIAKEEGALDRNSALARWVVVLAGAYIMNAGYALILLIKNKSFGSYGVQGGISVLKWAVIAGLLWFAALGTYGQAVALLGKTGTMIGWPIMLGLSLIVSNAVAVMTGEWKGAGKPMKLMIVGVIIIIGATALMTYASTLPMGETDVF